MELWFGVLTGLWGIGMIAVLILAIRLSYRVEARSDGLVNTSGLPRRAMLLHTVTNWKVARDEQTQALRRRMNRLLLVNAAGFAVFALFLLLSGRWAA